MRHDVVVCILQYTEDSRARGADDTLITRMSSSIEPQLQRISRVSAPLLGSRVHAVGHATAQRQFHRGRHP